MYDNPEAARILLESKNIKIEARYIYYPYTKSCFSPLFLIQGRVDDKSKLKTPLHYACLYNCIDVALILMEKGASINLTDRKGQGWDLPNLNLGLEKANVLLISKHTCYVRVQKEGIPVYIYIYFALVFNQCVQAVPFLALV
jgi:hypothetical protein